MQIAFVLYPDFTVLDLIGPYQVLAKVPGVRSTLVAERPGPVIDDNATLSVVATAAFEDVPAPDVVVLPGGEGSSRLLEECPLHEWLRAVDASSTWMTSVCTGSTILAASGLLRGRRATGHWLVMDQLAELGAVPTPGRVVTDGHYITAAGVSAGIDMALTLAGRIAGDDAARKRQLMMEYDPEPPYDAGSPDTAPQHIVQDILGRRSEILTGIKQAPEDVRRTAVT